MIKIILYIFLTTIVYIYLHNPIFTFIGIGSIKLLYPLLLLLLLSAEVRKNLKNQNKIIVSFISILIYCILRTIAGGDSNYVYTTIIAIIEVGLLSSIIITIIRIYKLDFTKIILYVGAISSIITIIAIAIPSFKLFILSQTDNSEYLERAVYRGFGLSEGLTYSYGIILGIIGGLSLPELNRNKWFILFIPLVALSILINARTGFIILGISLIIYFIIGNKKGKVKILSILSIVFLIIYINMGSLHIFEYEQSIDFIESFFLQMSDSLFGTNKSTTDTASVLFGDMMVFPETSVEWIVGKGESIFLARNNSDVGFILQLNYGGIIYMILLTILMFIYFSKISNKYIFYLLLAAFFVANVKGNFIINSGGFRLFALVCCWYMPCKTYQNKIYSVSN